MTSGKRKKIVHFVVLPLAGAAIIAGLIALPFALNDQLWFRVSGKNRTAAIEGRLGPTFTLKEMRSSEDVSLEQFRGKPTVVQFYASWCNISKLQLRRLDKLWRMPGIRDVANIVAVDIRSSKKLAEGFKRERMTRFLDKKGYEFPVLQGDHEVMADYRLQLVPELVILDATGVIRYSGLSLHEAERILELIHDVAGAA